MQEKNRNILIGSILMISGAGLSVVLTLVYGSVFGRSLEAYVGTLTADEAFAAELAASGMTLDAVVEAMQGTLTVLLVLAVLFQLVKIILQVEGVFLHLPCKFLGLFLIVQLLSFLDKRYDIAHSENALCDTVRMEHLQVFHLLACTDELERLADNTLERECRTASGV